MIFSRRSFASSLSRSRAHTKSLSSSTSSPAASASASSSSKSASSSLSLSSFATASVSSNSLSSMNDRLRIRISSRGMSTPSSTSTAKQNAMFCFQCEQTESSTGCTTVGVCGKSPNVASLQNVIEFLVRGTASYIDAANTLQQEHCKQNNITQKVTVSSPTADLWMLHSLFATMTNVNFDDTRMIAIIHEGEQARNEAKKAFMQICSAYNLDSASMLSKFHLDSNTWATTPLPLLSSPSSELSSLVSFGREHCSIEKRQVEKGKDFVGLSEMALYGLKGTAAYAHHVYEINPSLLPSSTYASMWSILSQISSPTSSIDSLLSAALDVGALNLVVMSALTAANRTYGTPTPTTVNCKAVQGKAVLVSGHDLRDLEEILKQTQGRGVNVYTHGELLPAHSYPKLKAYKHLVGHYGGPWQLQKYEFGSFPGSIIMTSNCIVEPMRSYKDRIFTTGVVGVKGVKHLTSRNYEPAIAEALKQDGFSASSASSSSSSSACSRPDVMSGFGHEVILSLADKILAGVSSGAIKHVFYIGGCDGSEGERSYFTKLAEATGKDTIVLTAGCGKYRVNRLPMASEVIDVQGTKIPRLLDLGQCNDSYSGILIADALRGALSLPSVNSLPLSFEVSWFEQKAVAILLSLLKLGVTNIYIGPNLPGFATENMLNILNKKFNLRKINTNDVTNDLQQMIENKQPEA